MNIPQSLVDAVEEHHRDWSADQRAQNRNFGRWALDLICCGLDDGSSLHPTWDEANQTRFDYMSVPGHIRSAILRRANEHDPRPSTMVRIDAPTEPREGASE